MAVDDYGLHALSDQIEAILAKLRKAGSLREDVDRLERAVQALTAEMADLKRSTPSRFGHRPPVPTPRELR